MADLDRGRIPMSVRYSLASDTLFATHEPPRRAVAHEAAPDLLLRRDAETGEVIGFECLDFSVHAQDPGWFAAAPDIGPVHLPPSMGGGEEDLSGTLRRLWTFIASRSSITVDLQVAAGP